MLKFKENIRSSSSSIRMAREGDYNFQGSELDRGVDPEPRETPSGYTSKFLDTTKAATPQPKSDSAVTLENTEGDATLTGNYNFEGSELDRGVKLEPRQTEDGYTSTFLDKTKVATPAPKSDSAVTLENTEGDATLTGNYNFEGSDLDRGVKLQPKESQDGYNSTFLEGTKAATPAPKGDSAITLENTEGGKTLTGNFNFEGSELERGLQNKPRVTDEGYSSSFLDKTKVETPNPTGESAVTLENTEGEERKMGDFNFEGSDLDRGVDSRGFLEKTKVETPSPTGESAVTLGNST